MYSYWKVQAFTKRKWQKKINFKPSFPAWTALISATTYKLLYIPNQVLQIIITIPYSSSSYLLVLIYHQFKETTSYNDENHGTLQPYLGLLFPIWYASSLVTIPHCIVQNNYKILVCDDSFSRKDQKTCGFFASFIITLATQ